MGWAFALLPLIMSPASPDQVLDTNCKKRGYVETPSDYYYSQNIFMQSLTSLEEHSVLL